MKAARAKLRPSQGRRAFSYGFAVSEGIKPPGQACPDCNKIQPPRLFEGLGETFENCSICRSQGKPERRRG